MTTKLSFDMKPMQVLLQQLWLSLSRVDFYYNLAKFYRGYGIKYFLNQIVICIILSSIFIFNNILSIKNYLIKDQISPYTSNIDHVIKQLPNFYYDGIALHENDQQNLPIYIKDIKGRNLAVFDFGNILSKNEKDKIPLIFSAKKLIVNLTKKNQTSSENVVLNYSQILGKDPKIINKDSIKIAIKEQLSTFFSLFLIIIFATLHCLFYSIVILVMQFFLISMIYIITEITDSTFNIEKITKKFTSSPDEFFRILCFSSGSILLVQFIFIHLMPNQIFLVNLLHLWVGYLIYQSQAKRYQL